MGNPKVAVPKELIGLLLSKALDTVKELVTKELHVFTIDPSGCQGVLGCLFIKHSCVNPTVCD